MEHLFGFFAVPVNGSATFWQQIWHPFCSMTSSPVVAYAAYVLLGIGIYRDCSLYVYLILVFLCLSDESNQQEGRGLLLTSSVLEGSTVFFHS